MGTVNATIAVYYNNRRLLQYAQQSLINNTAYGCHRSDRGLQPAFLGSDQQEHQNAAIRIRPERFVENVVFTTAVSFWGQTTQTLSGLSPNGDCGPKRANLFGIDPRDIDYNSGRYVYLWCYQSTIYEQREHPQRYRWGAVLAPVRYDSGAFNHCTSAANHWMASTQSSKVTFGWYRHF